MDQRLLSAAGFVRGGILADIGTDHAYLPVYLILHGKIRRAVASDINEGPLERGRKTAARYGVSDRIDFLRSDGLDGTEKFSPDDIAVLGMGGDLICGILEKAGVSARNEKYRFILQPMTKQDRVRKYLICNGFDIVGESLSSAKGKIYQTICAEYTGKTTEYEPAELLFGRKNILSGTPLLYECLAKAKRVYEDTVRGKEKAGLDASAEKKILEDIRKICSTGEKT